MDRSAFRCITRSLSARFSEDLFRDTRIRGKSVRESGYGYPLPKTFLLGL
jgi:hypothetical protein